MAAPEPAPDAFCERFVAVYDLCLDDLLRGEPHHVAIRGPLDEVRFESYTLVTPFLVRIPRPFFSVWPRYEALTARTPYAGFALAPAPAGQTHMYMRQDGPAPRPPHEALWAATRFLRDVFAADPAIHDL